MVSQFLYFLFSPPAVVWALLSGAIWLWIRPRSNGPRRFILCAALSYLLASTYIVPAGLSRLLTIDFRAFTAEHVSRSPTAVVVLGTSDEPVEAPGGRLTVSSITEAVRVLEAWRVFKLISPAWIVSSGGPPQSAPWAAPSSAMMRDHLVRMGVTSERILLESASRDTNDEAALIAPMLRARGIEQVVLVTSDVHMRRSLQAFRTHGIKAIPAIARDPRWFTPWSDWLLPTAEGLSFSGSVVHEVIGIPYYWLRGAM